MVAYIDKRHIYPQFFQWYAGSYSFKLVPPPNVSKGGPVLCRCSGLPGLIWASVSSQGAFIHHYTVCW